MKKLFLLVFLAANFFSQAQEFTTTDKKAIKLYNTAKQNFINLNYEEAELLLKDAIKKDSAFVEAYYLLSGTYQSRGMKNENISTLQTCIRLNGSKYPIFYYYLAYEQFEYGMYSESLENYKIAASNSHYLAKAQTEKVLKGIEKCEFAVKQVNNPVPFVPENLGANVNTQWDDYLPSLTADERMMIVTSRVPCECPNNQKMNGYVGQEDFFLSFFENGVWTSREHVGPPINSGLNEGAQSMSADGKKFVFTVCGRADSFGSCDLYFSEKRGKTWTIPRNIGKPINTSYWESQPSLSADGRVLYFVSNRPGGLGAMDIWVSNLDQYGEWTPPKNVGEVINTPLNETSPFVHQDGKTLYFSSNGHIGMGKGDIFYTRKDASKMWTKPVNIGYPINTFEDEQDLIVGAKGSKAYFSSSRLAGQGNLDIYSFDLYEDARPISVTYVKGNIFDVKTNKKLNALFELYDLESGDLIVQSVSDSEDGSFLVPLPTGGDYALNVSRNGYLFYSQHFSLENLEDPTQSWGIDIPLQPIEKGGRVILNNVFFDTDSTNLKKESILELKKLYAFLNQNPTVKIEIGGHTDNTGIKQKNVKLSLERAKSVYTYIVELGIDKTRLSYVGYADTKPLRPNDSEENKALNRRTEFTIIEK